MKTPLTEPGDGSRAAPARHTIAGVVAAALLLSVGCRRETQEDAQDIFVVRRGALDITVVESGNLEAADAQRIENPVSRRVRIVEIVDEGTSITDEDVENGRVLVRFDDSELRDQLFERESAFEGAKASLTQSEEAVSIQQSENQSNIRSAELNLALTISDLRKLVGEVLADKHEQAQPKDVAALLDSPVLGGQARQDLRQHQSDIELAKIKLNRAQEKLKHTRVLYEKNYVSKNEFEGDELEARTCELSLESAEAKLGLFRRYEFVKTFQKTWSAVLEAREKLERSKAVARSKLAQAQAAHSSKQAAFRREKDRLAQHNKDIESCVIKATKPGFVIYRPTHRWSSEGPIRVGSEIQPKRTLLELPDLSRMVAKVEIHEAMIDLVTVDQNATVKVEPMPDRTFTGKVTKKAVLPSSQSRWLNPDLKVYEAKIALDEGSPDLRPGMTATVEILAESIPDVLHVPIQSVTTDEAGKHHCYLESGKKTPVDIGKRNQIFVVVTEGLKEGDRILMNAPELAKAAK